MQGAVSVKRPYVTADMIKNTGRTAREVDEHDDPDTMLAAIVAAAVMIIPGTDEGSIGVVLGRRRIISEASMSDSPAKSTPPTKKSSKDPDYQHPDRRSPT